MSSPQDLHFVFGRGLLGKALERQLLDLYADTSWVCTVSGLRHTDGDSFAETLAAMNANARVAGWSVGQRSQNGKVTFWIAGGLVGGAYINQRQPHRFAGENLTYFLACLRAIQIFVDAFPTSSCVVGFGSTCQLIQSPAGLAACTALDAGLTDLHPGNRGYALAKNAALGILLEHAEVFDRVAWFNPPNLLGADDPALIASDALSGHVVPGMIERHAKAFASRYSPPQAWKHPGRADYSRDFATADFAARAAAEYLKHTWGSAPPAAVGFSGRLLMDAHGEHPIRAVIENLPPSHPGTTFAELDREIAYHLGCAAGSAGVENSRAVAPLGFLDQDATEAPPSKKTLLQSDKWKGVTHKLYRQHWQPLTEVIRRMVSTYIEAHPNWHSHD